MAENKHTHVALVLDRSGSMFTIRDETIDAFNEQLKEIQNADVGRRTVTLVTFGGGGFHPEHPPVRVETKAAAPDSVAALTRDTYSPSGTTPMYDGVGEALGILEGLDDRGDDTAFLVVIVSDGMENSSREWTADRIAERVRKLEGTGRWTFVYLGANQNLRDIQKHLGIQQTHAFAANSQGMRNVGQTLSASTRRYMTDRGAGATRSASFYDPDAATSSAPEPETVAG